MNQKPVLSIGIIFRDDIRCIERCLRALQPLRDAIPCELVMADTGSVDGSRKIAEQYADIVFDFPWINDFAAARNAVMDRCSGKWYFSIDTDEWLDPDIAGLLSFLWAPQSKKYTNCGLMIRNYLKTLDGDYSDFMAIRFVRMDLGLRYTGAIHERWPEPEGYAVFGLRNTFMYHDGYMELNADQGRAKRKRNMTLLKEELQKNPENITVLIQCIESSLGDPDHETYICQAMDAVKKKVPLWNILGPAIFRHAVISAQNYGLPELEERIELCREWFPDSPYTLIDVAYVDFVTDITNEKYAEAISCGKIYLKAIEDYRAGRYDTVEMLNNAFLSASEPREYMCRLLLADAYFQEKQYQQAIDTLQMLDCARLSEQNVRDYLGVLMNLHAQSGLDMSLIAADFWEKIARPVPDEDKAAVRLSGFDSAAAAVFGADYRAKEEELGCRHAYTIFLPLVGKCEAGTAARVLESDNRDEMEGILHGVQDWGAFPVAVLAYALDLGVMFPLEEKPLKMEEMDLLAGILAKERDIFFRIVEKVDCRVPLEWQRLNWYRALALTAVNVLDWKGESAEQGLGLSTARIFARTETQFLRRFYSEEALEEGNLFTLPSMHRFGWYCAQAFDALDNGNPVDYVRLLRAGLESCGDMKPMVEFLLENTPELQTPAPSAELQTLAEQIRTVLSNFAPDDPAVTALKQSEAYRKVAHLIEGIEVPVVGGLKQ